MSSSPYTTIWYETTKHDFGIAPTYLDRRYKSVVYHGHGPSELYDPETDPDEVFDLREKPEVAAIKQEITIRRLDAYARSTLGRNRAYRSVLIPVCSFPHAENDEQKRETRGEKTHRAKAVYAVGEIRFRPRESRRHRSEQARGNAKTYYCGTVSGRDSDKAALFEVFYGDLENAPLIAESPVSLECRVVKEFSMTHRQVFVGEVLQTHVNQDLVEETDGRRKSAGLPQIVQ
jgi:hypothetical protein